MLIDTDAVKLDGNKVHLLRRRKRWNQQKLADEAGASVNTVCNIEGMKNRTRLHIAEKIAKALGVALEELIFEVDPEELRSCYCNDQSFLVDNELVSLSAGVGDPIQRLDLVQALGSEMPSLLESGDRSITLAANYDSNLAAISSLMTLSPQTQSTLTVREVHTLPELQALWTIDNKAYGRANVPFDIFRAWWLAYRPGLQAIIREEQIVGALGLWPVPEYWLTDFRAGIAAEADLLATMIVHAGRQDCRSWYISGIVLDPRWQLTSAIRVLLRGALINWALKARLAFPATVSAIAISVPGERLLGRFGFSLVTPGDMMKDGYPLYSRTLDHDDIKSLLV